MKIDIDIKSIMPLKISDVRFEFHEDETEENKALIASEIMKIIIELS